MQGLITGGIAMGWLVASLFFFRFWRRTRDSFFLWFALSFLLEACDRVALGLRDVTGENSPVVYGLRVVAYGFILYAIWQKNRPGR